jgi:hypothetical protein
MENNMSDKQHMQYIVLIAILFLFGLMIRPTCKKNHYFIHSEKTAPDYYLCQSTTKTYICKREKDKEDNCENLITRCENYRLSFV